MYRPMSLQRQRRRCLCLSEISRQKCQQNCDISTSLAFASVRRHSVDNELYLNQRRRFLNFDACMYRPMSLQRQRRRCLCLSEISRQKYQQNCISKLRSRHLVNCKHVDGVQFEDKLIWSLSIMRRPTSTTRRWY
jgi:hypothetical protein